LILLLELPGSLNFSQPIHPKIFRLFIFSRLNKVVDAPKMSESAGEPTRISGGSGGNLSFNV
jgi:hypothetical protein